MVTQREDGSGSQAGYEAIPGDTSFLNHALGLGEAEGRHCTLAELERCARERAESIKAGKEWDVPEHIAACPSCMEAFDAAIACVGESLSPKLARRYEGIIRLATSGDHEIDNEVDAIVPICAAPSYWREGVMAAMLAAAIMLACAYLLLWTSAPRTVQPGPVVVGQLADGSIVHADQDFRPKAETMASLPDGSSLKIAPGTLLSLRKPENGVTIDLKAGEVLATVAKQHEGKRFSISTPLGEVVAIGTCFSVTCESDNAGAANPIPARVKVKVLEGTVKVLTSNETQSLAAGKAAEISLDKRITVN